MKRSGVFVGMLSRVAALAISRWGLFAFNVVTLLITALLMVDMIGLLLNKTLDFSRIDDIVDNVASVLVVFGVLIEERKDILELLKKFFKGIKVPDAISKFELKHGILFLIIGLLMEVFVEMYKIPLRFAQTPGMELLLGTGVILLCLISMFGSCVFFYELLRVKPRSNAAIIE